MDNKEEAKKISLDNYRLTIDAPVKTQVTHEERAKAVTQQQNEQWHSTDNKSVDKNSVIKTQGTAIINNMQSGTDTRKVLSTGPISKTFKDRVMKQDLDDFSKALEDL